MVRSTRRLSRRDFLKQLGAGAGAVALGGGAAAALAAGAGRGGRLAGAGLGEGAAGAAAGLGMPPEPRFAGETIFPDFPLTQLYKKVETPSRVSLVKGESRYDIVMRALKLVEDDVLAAIGNKRVLVKPNIVLSQCALCCTPVEATRAVLDWLKPHYRKRVLIAESGNQNTMEGFKNYGYLDLKKNYDVEIADLNLEKGEYRYMLGLDNKPVGVRIIKTFLDPDVYVISLARMKTHNYVFVTLSLKNVLMAAPLNEYGGRNDKGLMHMAAASRNDLLHFNMFHLGQEVWPDLAVIDGFEGMEGKGPAWGTPIASRVALASRDALACDITGTRVMGYDPKTINYLTAMAEAGMGQGDTGKIEIVGTPLEQCVMKYKPNPDMAEIYK